MRSVIAAATAVLFTVAVTGSALAASASSIHHHGLVQVDKKGGNKGGKTKKN
jgi:hypothetical protein